MVKKSTKKRDARGKLLFCVKSYCFSDVLFAVAVVVARAPYCLSVPCGYSELKMKEILAIDFGGFKFMILEILKGREFYHVHF